MSRRPKTLNYVINDAAPKKKKKVAGRTKKKIRDGCDWRPCSSHVQRFWSGRPWHNSGGSFQAHSTPCPLSYSCLSPLPRRPALRNITKAGCGAALSVRPVLIRGDLTERTVSGRERERDCRRSGDLPSAPPPRQAGLFVLAPRGACVSWAPQTQWAPRARC